MRRSKGDKSTDSSGCSSCECTDCREQGDVCYSCSLYNESSNAGTLRSQNTVKSDPSRSPLDTAAPDSPLTAWRNNMMKTGDPEDKRDLMAGMSSSAIPQRKQAGGQVVPHKVSQQLSRPVSSSNTSKSARRQFRENMREIAGAGDSSSDYSSLPRHSRQPRQSTTQSWRERSRPGSSSLNQRHVEPSPPAPAPAPASHTEHGQEGTPGGSLTSVPRVPGRPVMSSVSGHSRPRPGTSSIKSQGSGLSIDSLSGSSSYSQKIAFSETNMQSSLGYLP